MLLSKLHVEYFLELKTIYVLWILVNKKSLYAMAVCERLRKKNSSHRFKYNSSDFSISISAGIALYNNLVHRSPVELVSAADQALYQAKKEGRNSVRYHPDNH